MSVNFEYNKAQNQLNITVSGHFNFSLVSEFRSIYAQVEKVNSIVVNMEGTDVIDSSGLGILLYMQKHYSCKRDKITLINCNASVKKTFNMTQFKKLFTYE